MKRLILILWAAALALPMQAQTRQARFGHVDYAEILQKMPGVDTAQKAISDYQTELQTTGDQMLAEIKTKEEEFVKLSNSGTSPSILKLKQDELKSMYARVQEFASNSQTDLQNKQIEMLHPFQTKALAAIKKVAEAKGYTYVFDIQTLLYYEDTHDLTAAVKAELGIK